MASSTYLKDNSIQQSTNVNVEKTVVTRKQLYSTMRKNEERLCATTSDFKQKERPDAEEGKRGVKPSILMKHYPVSTRNTRLFLKPVLLLLLVAGKNVSADIPSEEDYVSTRGYPRYCLNSPPRRIESHEQDINGAVQTQNRIGLDSSTCPRTPWIHGHHHSHTTQTVSKNEPDFCDKAPIYGHYSSGTSSDQPLIRQDYYRGVHLSLSAYALKLNPPSYTQFAATDREFWDLFCTTPVNSSKIIFSNSTIQCIETLVRRGNAFWHLDDVFEKDNNLMNKSEVEEFTKDILDAVDSAAVSYKNFPMATLLVFLFAVIAICLLMYLIVIYRCNLMAWGLVLWGYRDRVVFLCDARNGLIYCYRLLRLLSGK